MELSDLFNTAAIALAIDLLLVFPVSHTSMIGQFITGVAGSVVVPPLDWVATNLFGMESAASQLTTQAAAAETTMRGGAAVAGGATAIPPAAPAPVPTTPPPSAVEGQLLGGTSGVAAEPF